MTSTRLDEALVARGLVQSRARARDAVLRGIVAVNGEPARKPSQSVAPQDALTLRDDTARFVSRAALKLIHALDHFGISPAGMQALDVGASTGGFTQVLLERGATHVTAIDVGHGQLVPALTEDPRVTNVEGLNARDLTRAHMPEAVGIIVSDVSFISLRLALAPALNLARPRTWLVTLIKPQFEVGREHVGKGGIVRDGAQQQRVCEETANWLVGLGWQVLGVTPSPVEGGDGNREFLLAAQKR